MLIHLIENLSNAVAFGLAMHNAGADEVLRSVTSLQQAVMENMHWNPPSE